MPGYVTEVFRMPVDHLYVAVLTNSDSPSIDPDTAAAKIAAEAIDRPYHDPAAIPLPMEVLDSYVGIYQIDPENARTISRDGTHMFMQRTGGRKIEIFPVRAEEFFLANSFQRLSFTQDGAGRVVRVVSRWLDGTPDVGEKILSKAGRAE